MQKTKLLFLALIFSLTGNATNVSVPEAAEVAGNFYIQEAGLGSGIKFSVSLIEVYVSSGDTIFYTFLVNQGFVIVSADNRIRPVLGFAIDGSYDVLNKPPALEIMLEKHSDFVKSVNSAGLKQGKEAAKAWNDMKSPVTTKNAGNNVPTLLTSSWDEGCNYNLNFPPDSNGVCGRTFTGSLGVAMGQVMNFYNYPPRGTDSISYLSNYGTQSVDFEGSFYNWDSMPDVINAGNTEIPQLLFHAAAAVEANFSTSIYNINCQNIGVDDIRSALIDHFGYTPAMQDVYGYQHTDSAWVQMIRAELDNGRPVIFSGQPQLGCNRIFVIDGYQNQVYFHMNFGWGGTFNGFYLMDQINLASINYNFNTNQQALLGIQPLHKTLTGKYYYGFSLNVYLSNETLLLKRMNGQVIDTAIIQSNGHYVFSDISNGVFMVELMNFPAWGGANAADALIALNSFIGLYNLSGMKFEAADVDGTAYVNSTDALLIGRRFVGFINNFQTSDWIISDNEVIINGSDVNFVMRALCRGDIDGSHTP